MVTAGTDDDFRRAKQFVAVQRAEVSGAAHRAGLKPPPIRRSGLGRDRRFATPTWHGSAPRLRQASVRVGTGHNFILPFRRPRAPPLADKMWDIRRFLEKHFVLTRPGQGARGVLNPRKSVRRAASSTYHALGQPVAANLGPTRLSFRLMQADQCPAAAHNRSLPGATPGPATDLPTWHDPSKAPPS